MASSESSTSRFKPLIISREDLVNNGYTVESSYDHTNRTIANFNKRLELAKQRGESYIVISRGNDITLWVKCNDLAEQPSESTLAEDVQNSSKGEVLDIIS